MVYLQAKTWRVLPSEILFMEEGVEAYFFNRAVYKYGTALEAALDSVESNKKDHKAAAKEVELKRTQILEKWIPKAEGAPEQKPKRRFADPAKR